MVDLNFDGQGKATAKQQIDQAAPLVTDHLVSRCLDHVYRYYIHCMKSLPLEDFDPRLDDGQATERKTEEKESVIS